MSAMAAKRKKKKITASLEGGSALGERKRLLVAHPVGDTDGWQLLPAPAKRGWMDDTVDSFAYRCLPLGIANQAGWILTCPVCFEATWNGRESPSGSILFVFDGPTQRYERQIQSHFGSGIITFAVPYLFRTEPGIGLLVRGLPNSAKHGCVPLEGFVETDWSSSTFTMNWKVQQPNMPVSLVRGEPICFIQPFDIALIERTKPVIRPLESNPALTHAYSVWRDSRERFNASPDRGTAWQKHYYLGHDVLGGPAKGHKKTLDIRTFESDA